MIAWFGSLFERLVGIVGAVLFSQLPLFMLQYTHQMVGHVAELQRHVSAITQVAAQGGKTLDALIQKFLLSADADFRAQGMLMQGMIQRWHQLSEGLVALQHAEFWQRPFVFLKYVDSDVVRDTYRAFEPGIPMTVEGTLYAIVGLLVGMALCKGVRALFARKERGGSPATF